MRRCRVQLAKNVVPSQKKKKHSVAERNNIHILLQYTFSLGVTVLEVINIA